MEVPFKASLGYPQHVFISDSILHLSWISLRKHFDPVHIVSDYLFAHGLSSVPVSIRFANDLIQPEDLIAFVAGVDRSIVVMSGIINTNKNKIIFVLKAIH